MIYGTVEHGSQANCLLFTSKKSCQLLEVLLTLSKVLLIGTVSREDTILTALRLSPGLLDRRTNRNTRYIMKNLSPHQYMNIIFSRDLCFFEVDI